MLKGSFELIGDKSISHRAVMFSSISKGYNKISNFLMGQDCLSTISCFRKMGVDINIDGKDVYVKGNGLYGLQKPNEILDVGNSGTTIRLMMGILAGATTDPPALAYSTATANNDIPSVGYSTVYPLSMFLRIITAQLIILLLCS